MPEPNCKNHLRIFMKKKDTRSRISSCSCEIASLAFLYNKWQKAKWGLARRLQTDRHTFTQSSPSHIKILSPKKIPYDGALACVLMDPWSSSWSRLRSGGSIWTVEDKSNIFLSIASMATCLRGERKEKWGGGGMECKGRMISWGYAEHTMVWLLYQLATSQKAVGRK